MKAKHTPGPWSIPSGGWAAGFESQGGSQGGHISTLRPTGKYIKKGDDFVPEPPVHETLICSYMKSGLPQGEGEANGRLIAASPDMLEALERATSQIAIWRSVNGDMVGELERLESQCRAAIAKALGTEA